MDFLEAAIDTTKQSAIIISDQEALKPIADQSVKPAKPRDRNFTVQRELKLDFPISF